MGEAEVIKKNTEYRIQKAEEKTKGIRP